MRVECVTLFGGHMDRVDRLVTRWAQQDLPLSPPAPHSLSLPVTTYSSCVLPILSVAVL